MSLDTVICPACGREEFETVSAGECLEGCDAEERREFWSAQWPGVSPQSMIPHACKACKCEIDIWEDGGFPSVRQMLADPDRGEAWRKVARIILRNADEVERLTGDYCFLDSLPDATEL